MSSINATSMTVLRNFVASANAQYRDAGLGQYQMRVRRDGSVTMPDRPSPEFKAPTAAGSSAGEQAAAGTQQPAPAAGQAKGPKAGAEVRRTGAAPRPSDLKETKDGFSIAWQPVPGAKQYGVWQDGVLLGHVTKPSFAAALAAGASGTVQIDAVRADGTRTELTKALVVRRGADGKVSFEVPGAAQPAAATAAQPAAAPATAPAAPAG